tara:strand:- start:513 stop:773 length:261 start_codon:yes stop_codon:yes gene_type:complete
MNNKTLHKKDKKRKFFMKYSKNKEYCTKTEIKKLLRKGFFLNYNECVIQSMMSIWGTSKNGRKVITYNDFLKMFEKKEGFLRDIKF